ncbi:MULTISPECIES: nitronate monooxygenase [Thermocrispum]|jgi:nitronate monooxygenase|uniref:Nitronate monooxygenase n=1 Tax=Thermocrispum agreste TaxID=37925 RepID=A0ABD6FDD5_9PSEU|nr:MULTISPECIES: nitronate monooxygenase [Thermocrispum]
MALPAVLRSGLEVPVIAAPMTRVSGPELVVAACRAGVIGAFPTHNARDADELDAWLHRIRHDVAEGSGAAAAFAANLVVHRSNHRLDEDMACLIRHRVPVVITSVGSPVPVVGPLHDAGCLVLADVATMRHVERALAAGVDGLVLLTAGAGGQTGWLNPLAFVRAVRREFAGPVVLAGGVTDGATVFAAEVLGADLCYMGTAFIATTESRASDAYRNAVVAAGMDDVVQTTAATGLPANLLRSWWERHTDHLGRSDGASGTFTFSSLLGDREPWAAGHSVAGVDRVRPVAALVESVRKEYQSARAAAFGTMP